VKQRPPQDQPELSERERAVLRAMVSAYLAEAAPIGSGTIAALLATRVSSATIRSTLSELGEKGLVEQPHTSAGRVPTEAGLRFFIDALLDRREVEEADRRTLSYEVGVAEIDSVVPVAAELLSQSTRQLGFIALPTLEQVVLQHVSLVRLGGESVLVLLVSATGTAYRRVVHSQPAPEQRDLEKMAAHLNGRITGRTLRQARDVLARDARAGREHADTVLARAIALAKAALSADEGLGADLVVATRLALLDQPEFQDPRRVRDLFEAVETKEGLLEVLDQVLDEPGVSVLLGGEVSEPALRSCALVATRYGDFDAPLGVLGVIGPARMNYARVIPLVDYFSHLVTEKLSE
jgi:heat-inducible transcriptional repressor